MGGSENEKKETWDEFGEIRICRNSSIRAFTVTYVPFNSVILTSLEDHKFIITPNQEGIKFSVDGDH